MDEGININDQMQEELLEEITSINTYLNEIRRSLLIFKRNEMSVELPIQLTINLMMLLLCLTAYPTEDALKTVFLQTSALKMETALYLTMSVIWSFKTAGLTFSKIKEDRKQFLTFLAKLTLGSRAMTVFIARISMVVAYFSPFLGLGGIY